MNNVVMTVFEYGENEPAKYFAGFINFFMHVKMNNRNREEQELVLACLDLHPIVNMSVDYPSGGELEIPNCYLNKRGGRILRDIIIPVDELGKKLGVLEENRTCYYYSFDGRVHFN